MSNTVTTSLVVQFDATNSSGKLAAEIDSRPAGYNNGKTSFAPGDQPAFLIFKSADVTIDSVVPSAGAIADLVGGTITVEEMIEFADTDTASLSKACDSGITTSKWLGTSLGAVTLVGDSQLVAAVKGVGVLKVTYQARFVAKRLVSVPAVLNGETTYEVLIVITGSTS